MSAPAAIPPPIPAPRSSLEGWLFPLLTAAPPVMPPTVAPMTAPATAQVLQLRSRTAHVVRVVSFGYINPRRVVAAEVEKALVEVGDMLNFTLWWVSLQIGLRIAFGMSLWLTWAVTS